MGPRRLAAGLLTLCATVVLGLPSSSRAEGPGYGLGRPATPREVAGWDIDVRPDGQGLPKGSGSVSTGQELYDAKCASCHGTFGEDNQYMAIAGGVQQGDVERGRASSFSSGQPMRTVGTKLNHATTLWDYINRAMPFTQPKTLTPDEVYALTAYVLNLNEILPADATLDEKSILQVKMPNRAGFTDKHGFLSKSGKPDVQGLTCTKCPGQVKLTSELPAHAQGLHGDLSEQVRSYAPTSGNRGGKAAACHGIDNKVVGPGFRELAARYKTVAGAEATLLDKVKKGGSGTWGPVPMPPQAHVAEEDLKTIVRWILAGAPTP
jgi:cytochrome c